MRRLELLVVGGKEKREKGGAGQLKIICEEE